jgi:hypothetical protein
MVLLWFWMGTKRETGISGGREGPFFYQVGPFLSSGDPQNKQTHTHQIIHPCLLLMNSISLSAKQNAFISRAVTGNIAQMRILYRAISNFANESIMNVALITACKHGQLETVKYLLSETGADIDAVCETYLEWLMGKFASESSPDNCMQMAKHGPLRIALKHCQNDVVLFLLKNGAKIYTSVLASAMNWACCASLYPLVESGAIITGIEFEIWYRIHKHISWKDYDLTMLLEFLVTHQRLQQRNDNYQDYLMSRLYWKGCNVEIFENSVNTHSGDKSTTNELKRILIRLQSQLDLKDDEIQFIRKSTRRTITTWLRDKQEQKAKVCGHDAVEVFSQCAVKDIPLVFSWLDKDNQMFHLIGLVDHLSRSHKNPLTREYFTSDEIGKVYKLYFNLIDVWKEVDSM